MVERKKARCITVSFHAQSWPHNLTTQISAFVSGKLTTDNRSRITNYNLLTFPLAALTSSPCLTHSANGAFMAMQQRCSQLPCPSVCARVSRARTGRSAHCGAAHRRGREHSGRTITTTAASLSKLASLRPRRLFRSLPRAGGCARPNRTIGGHPRRHAVCRFAITRVSTRGALLGPGILPSLLRIWAKRRLRSSLSAANLASNATPPARSP